MIDKSINGGVTAQQGFALQRNIALFVILDNYENKFKGAKYFLSLEHLEDIVFCFLNDHDQAVKAETYQSKKKATGSWRINAELADIMVKILKTGKSLINDQYPKCPKYNHTLYFSTNATVELKAAVQKNNKNNGSESFSENINESNIEVEFDSLDDNIKNAITNYLGKKSSYKNEALSDELSNLRFLFIDFTRVNKEQENQLKGKIEEVFTNKIKDPKAALESIFKLFKKVELTYNQRNVARLSDKSKQVSSHEINDAIKIITTKSKAFDYWREQKSAISKILGIKPFEKETFEMNFTLAFDFFKSKDEAEHQKILLFVKQNYDKCSSFTEEDCIDELINKFIEANNSNLDENILKATMFAAYFESINKTEH